MIDLYPLCGMSPFYQTLLSPEAARNYWLALKFDMRVHRQQCIRSILNPYSTTPIFRGLVVLRRLTSHWIGKYLQHNGRHFADDIFKCTFMNEKFCISIQISLKFVPKGSIDNKSALVQVMAWRLTGDEPLPGPMLTQFTDAYMRH